MWMGWINQLWNRKQVNKKFKKKKQQQDSTMCSIRNYFKFKSTDRLKAKDGENILC